jgi:flagellar biosynthesis protein FliQ
LLATALAAGTLAGIGAALFRQILPASVIVLVACGLFLGAVLARVVKRTAVRRRTLAIVPALLASLVVVLIGHAWDYQQFRKAQAAVNPSARALVAQLSPDDPAQAQAAGIDLGAVKAMHVDSFIGYLDRAAHEGVTVSALGRHPLNLGYAGSYIYWLLELAAVAALAARPPARAARP